MGSPGSYVLVARVGRDTLLSVGQLGVFRFDAGFYCYCGSAMGPGGLEARLARHLRRRKKAHWHVDYLLQHAAVVQIWKARSTRSLECLFAQALAGMSGARVSVPGFGSSDCTCRTHLVHYGSLPSFGHFCTRLRAVGTHTPLHQQILHRAAEG